MAQRHLGDMSQPVTQEWWEAFGSALLVPRLEVGCTDVDAPAVEARGRGSGGDAVDPRRPPGVIVAARSTSPSCPSWPSTTIDSTRRRTACRRTSSRRCDGSSALAVARITASLTRRGDPGEGDLRLRGVPDVISLESGVREGCEAPMENSRPAGYGGR